MTGQDPRFANAVLHGPWRDESGLNWRVVDSFIGPQLQLLEGRPAEWKFITNRQPASSISRLLASELARLAAENRHLRSQEGGA